MPIEVYPGIHQIVLPLPKSPLKAVNCYLIKGADRHLLVDTGLNHPECRKTLETGLAELDVSLDDTDFFITHLHADHMGLVGVIAGDDATVYFNETEAIRMGDAEKAGGFGDSMSYFARVAGFSKGELEESLAKHPGLKYHAADNHEYTIVRDGQRLDIGDFQFECVQTPGHSPGHMCLYDRGKKLMICGDHVLAEISPNIGAWDKDDNPLGDYLESLDKVYDLDVELALPGHRRLLHDFHDRINELRAHHQERLDEVHTIVDGTPLSAYQIASQMTWDLKYDDWADVNTMQKWFAAGEAVAHLRHLLHDGHVKRAEDGDVVVYWRE